MDDPLWVIHMLAVFYSQTKMSNRLLTGEFTAVHRLPLTRLGRFFGIPENTSFFEKPVFRFCQSPRTEKQNKTEKTR
jgi:hypothetical protein